MKKKSLAKNAGLNMFRTFMNMAFPLITYPYITRVLGVNNIGKYNFSSSIIGYLALISGFGISSYAVREGAKLRETKDKETSFASQMFTISLTTTFLAYLIMAILCMVDSISPYTKLILIQSVTLIGTAVGVEWLNSVYEDFTYITIRTLVFQILSLVLMFLFVKDSNDLYVYAWISVLSSIGGYICNFFHCRKFVKFKITNSLNLHEHFKSLLTFFFSNLTTTIFVNSDQTMLGLMCGDYYVGLYAIAVKVYNVLKNIFSSILFVIIPRICSLTGNENERKRVELAEQTLVVILILVIPMSVGIFSVADKAVLAVGGSEYLGGTSSLRILACSVFAAALASYMTYIYVIPNGHDRILLISSTVSAFINVGLNLFMIPLWQHNGAALTTLISEFAVFVIEWLYVRPKMNYVVILKNFFQALISSLIMAIAIFAIDHINLGVVALTIVEVIVGVVIYYVLMILMRNKMIIKITYKTIGKMRNEK